MGAVERKFEIAHCYLAAKKGVDLLATALLAPAPHKEMGGAFNFEANV